MSNSINWSEWFDNTGVEPKIPEGRIVKLKYFSGMCTQTHVPRAVNWGGKTPLGDALLISRYRYELPDTAPEEEWGMRIGFNESRMPDGAVDMKVRVFWEGAKSQEVWAKDVDWHNPNIVAYQFKLTPEVKVRTAGVYVACGTKDIFVHSNSNLDPDYHLKLTLTETNGVREWSISEVKS